MEQWHDYAFTRDADGYWSIGLDGVAQSTTPGDIFDNDLTSFDTIRVQVIRDDSYLEWVRISTPEPGTLSFLAIGGLVAVRRRR